MADVAGDVTVQVGAEEHRQTLLPGRHFAAGDATNLGAPTTGGVMGVPGLTADGKDIDLTIGFQRPWSLWGIVEVGVRTDTGTMAVGEGMVTVMATMTPKEAGWNA